MTEKLFGTDGIRGIANTFPLTVDFCMKLAVSLSRGICLNHKRVAIARDTRISGDMLKCALCAGFTSTGTDVIDLGIIPTPLCTTLTPKLDVDMSIMITASHNPYQDNGLKLISASGDKFSDGQCAAVEALLAHDVAFTGSPDTIRRVIYEDAGLENYLQTVKKITSQGVLKGMKIAIDAANGSFSAIMPEIYKFLGAETVILGANPNGRNINLDCGSQHTEKLCQTVKDENCCLGIAVDGDGDRIILCDENGTCLDGDQIIAYLATYFYKHGRLKNNSVVATVYSNLGLGEYLKTLGINYFTSAVGERYVIEKMKETGANVGGEESGHIVLSDYSLTGDALLASVIICMGIKENASKVSEIFPVFTPFPCEKHNLRFSDKSTVAVVLAESEVQQCIRLIETSLAGHGRILVRKSGTEPVLRLKIEDKDADVARKQANKLLSCLKKFAQFKE